MKLLCSVTNDPKLAVFEHALTLLGIEHERRGRSRHASKLFANDPDGVAWRALSVTLGEIWQGESAVARAFLAAIGSAAIELLIQNHGAKCTFDDVPDDAPLLADDLDYYACSDDGDCV